MKAKMSRFFVEDTVAFRDDPSIIGTIRRTWRDIDSGYTESSDECYFHQELSAEKRRLWLREGRLLPGYVIIEFLEEYDGLCLIGEKSLRLVDRSFAVGDAVKRKCSNPQSGIVISTAMQCLLQSRCSLQAFRKAVDLSKISTAANQTKVCLECSSVPSYHHHLQVPASELTNWGDYHEEDFILYKDW